jgi:outer membrane protein assembly factor BamB
METPRNRRMRWCRRVRWCHAAAALLMGLVVHAASNAGDWPGWRGPTGMGFTDEKDLPVTWNAKTGENVVWKSLLHGGAKKNAEFSSPGWSSPIIWRDRIFLTTATWPEGLTEKERRASIAEHHVLCFQAHDGKQLWDTVIPAGTIVVDNFYHGYAVPTPATDGKLVYGLFGSGILAAVDFDGKIVWREELPHLKEIDGGICSSPILYKDTVIVPGIQSPGLRALDKSTGKLKWQEKTKQRNTMATPAVFDIGGRPQLIHYAGGIESLDPQTGALLWTCRVNVSHSSPVYGGGYLYADAGRGGQTGAAVDPTGMGDVTKTHVKWQNRVEGVAGSTAIIVGNHVYRNSGQDFIRCWSLANGELVHEIKAPRITPSASPIATPDGRIYFACSGKSYVIGADPKLEVLAVNDLNDGPDYTTPAVANGRIYIKGKSYLWCIGKK